MKRVFFLTVALAFFLSFPSWAGYFVSIATDDAFLYEKPSAKSEIVIGAPQYYPLYVIAKSGKWYKVKDWMRTVGWIHASDVSSTRTVIVNRFRVNFRSGPGTRYRKIKKIFKGYTFKVLQRKGHWLKVQLVDPLEKRVGWIYKTLVWGY